MEKVLFTAVFVLGIAACGGNVTVDCDSADDGSGGSTNSSTASTSSSTGEGTGGSGGGVIVEPSKGCDISLHDWQDEVLYVCPNPLPFTEMNEYAFVQVGSFQLVNYRSLWVNSITRVCVKNIGPTSLDTVTQVNFAYPGSAQGNVAVLAPWPADGKVCGDIAITVGGESTVELVVSIVSFPPTLPVGAQYQFEIESPSDITISGGDPEPIVGDFPIVADMVTIVEG